MQEQAQPLAQFSQIADPHKQDRKFQCSWQGCGKTFLRKTDVTRHYRIHLNDRPFKCVWPGCGKAFMQRSAVKIHYRTHTGEKPNICPFEGCNKAFNDTSSLARHRRTHHYDTPFPCSYRPCQERFATRKLLTEHERTMHNSSGQAPVKKVYSETDLKMELPTPQITPDNTPRTSPTQSNLTLQFQSYVPPPITEYQQRPVKEDGDYMKQFRQLEHERMVMDYRHQDMKNMVQFPPVRNDRIMDRYSINNPPPMLQIHENMNGGMMSPTYTPTMTHSNETYSPNMMNNNQQQLYMHHQMGQIPSPDEIQTQQGLMNEMNYQRSFNEDLYKPMNRREPPPRINTQLPMYSQPLTQQYQPYSFKQQQQLQDDRRFSAPILSPVYAKETQMNFGMPYEQQRQ